MLRGQILNRLFGYFGERVGQLYDKLQKMFIQRNFAHTASIKFNSPRFRPHSSKRKKCITFVDTTKIKKYTWQKEKMNNLLCRNFLLLEQHFFSR